VLYLGFGIGYVVYDAIHFACHQLPMRSPVLRQLRRQHIRHHHAKQEGNYAITAIFWDRLFGTDIPAKRP
jgi:sterol desaturase/sphingolipid hydroxylase (fatty acid hydroxylase superfamily)